MRRLIGAGAALAIALGLASPAAAAIRIAYDAAGDDPDLVQAREALVKSKALEELQTFLAPLRIYDNVLVRGASCGAERRDYDAKTHTVTICYDRIARIRKVAAEADTDDDSRRKAVVGTIVEDLLHETSYALFDIYGVPVWGRIDDAADRLAALVMTQFGEDNARTTILGVAMYLQWTHQTPKAQQYASAESPEAQRFYNFLCIAYGADPITFDGLREDILPQYRLRQCGFEFEQVRKAFNLRIMPFVDPDKFVQARARQW
jgi:hypothetical protein